jgi:saccharopine dehydrogenase-like NADP-dependent oxidoreductase
MGIAAAFDLLRDAEVQEVGLVGRSEATLAAAVQRLGRERLRPYAVPVEDPHLRGVMARYDVGILALPDRRSSYAALEAAIEARLSAVDILEEYHRRPDPTETEGLRVPPGMSLVDYGEDLHRRAQARGVTLLDGMGFAPGLSNVFVGEALRTLDVAEEATARVGGIPDKATAARHPLGYLVTWAFRHVLREYKVKVAVKRGGRIQQVEARSEREGFLFPLDDEGARGEPLECAVTPGMPSFLYTRPELAAFCEKTIRWPGHYAAIEVLDSCGLLANEPVETPLGQVAPREVLAALLEPRLRPLPGDRDVCVMWNTITGRRGPERVRIEQALWAEPDDERAPGFSAMARVTGFPAAIAARLLARGLVTGGPGLVAPEDGVSGAGFQVLVSELARRGLGVRQTIRSTGI